MDKNINFFIEMNYLHPNRSYFKAQCNKRFFSLQSFFFLKGRLPSYGNSLPQYSLMKVISWLRNQRKARNKSITWLQSSPWSYLLSQHTQLVFRLLILFKDFLKVRFSYYSQALQKFGHHFSNFRSTPPTW